MTGVFLYQERVVLADDDECECEPYYQYRCKAVDTCGTVIEKRTCWSGNCPCPRCTGASDHYMRLASWLVCGPGGKRWKTYRDPKLPNFPTRCAGKCLEAPKNPKYNGSSKNTDVKLPPEISWDNVPGFGVWNRTKHESIIEENGPSSYIITIEDTNAPPGGMRIDLIHDWDGTGKMTRFSSTPAYELVTTETLEDAEFYYTLNEETNEKEYRFIRPTSVRYLSSCFGWRPSTNSFHCGIDIAHHESVPIFASAPGTIIKVGTAGGYGKQVIIKHDDYKFQGIKKGTKIATQYAHLANFSRSIYQDNSEARKPKYRYIRAGDRITEDGKIIGSRPVRKKYDRKGKHIGWYYDTVTIRNDTVIGSMGRTGRHIGGGVHLHFEIRIGEHDPAREKRRYIAQDPLRHIIVPKGKEWKINYNSSSCKLNPPPQRLDTFSRDDITHPEKIFEIDGNLGKERDYPFTPPFEYNQVGDSLSVNVKGNRFTADHCMLKPNSEHIHTVKACCNPDGTECGPKAKWSMTTSDGMEVLSQGAEDGTSEDTAEIIYQLEHANLRWCPKWFEIKEGVFLPPDRYEIEVQQKLPFFWFWQRYKTHPLVGAMEGDRIIITANPPIETSPRTYIENSTSLLFTKSDYAYYRWRVRACKKDCTEFTPWRYIKIHDEVIIDKPFIQHPADDPEGKNPIGWPINFEWRASLGANSYIFELYDEENKLLHREVVQNAPSEEGKITRLHSITLPKDGVELELNKRYRWRVKSCWDTEANLCEKEWSERHFKTTGRAPNLQFPENNAVDAPIPLTLKWERIPGAKSYVINFNDNETVVTNNKVNVDYSILKSGTQYSWSVKSCNDVKGEKCGEKSETWYFQTLKLKEPEILGPLADTSFFSDKHNYAQLSWGKVLGARYYKINVSCGGDVIYKDITQNTKVSIPLKCIGDYSWTVTPCIDEKCEDFGPPINSSFTLQEGKGKAGFVPCGLSYNDPDTPWNEAEPCRASHLFVILKIILDFLFWNLMPLVLVVMTVVSGVIFYISLGDPNVVAKIKGVWSSVGKGLLIMFFGWTAITIIMAIMGYTGIFGPWWQVSF